MGDRRMDEDEVLRGGHLGGQGGVHGTLLLLGEGRGALALLRGSHDDLDGGDGGNQCGVGGGRRGSPSGVGDEWASGGEAARRLSGEAGWRERSRFHSGGEGAVARRVTREAEPRGEEPGCTRAGRVGSSGCTGRERAERSGGVDHSGCTGRVGSSGCTGRERAERSGGVDHSGCAGRNREAVRSRVGDEGRTSAGGGGGGGGGGCSHGGLQGRDGVDGGVHQAQADWRRGRRAGTQGTDDGEEEGRGRRWGTGDRPVVGSPAARRRGPRLGGRRRGSGAGDLWAPLMERAGLGWVPTPGLGVDDCWRGRVGRGK
jgi:hypothetical protein